MARHTSIDECIAALPQERRAVMEQLRATIAAAAPDATETISYDMPTFKRNGRFLVSFASYKQHYSLFPWDDAMVEAFGDELKPYQAGRGTIRFPKDQPLPITLVTKVVQARVAENEAEQQGKGPRSAAR